MINENRPTNASLSTMWAMKNFPDLNGFFVTAKKLGFQKIELNHQVNSIMLSHVRLDHIQFSSVHEPCPADISMSDLVKRDWLISSQDEDLRKRGVNAVKRSINLAFELGAPVVIIHCGNIPMNMSLEGELRALLEPGKVQSDEYLDIKSQCIQSRKDLAGPRLQAVKKSLNELIKFADQFQVKLGLENRYHFMDIPSIDEMGELLNLAESTRLGFIYDVGHAQALDRLGFYSHEDWLQRYSSRMFGSHLHDVIGVTDHYAPGLGEIDFKFIANFLPENAFRTFEMLPGNTLAQVNVGLDLMIETGCIKYL
jgi:sugar phosphate isomerase/epimerase